MGLLLPAAAGLLAGLLSGTFGIGGGVVLVPLLGLALGLGQHDAQGMTLAILLLPVGLAAVIEYHRAGRIRWPLVWPLIAGFLCGVGAGSVVATSIPERPLRLIFVLFLVALAVRNWRAAAAEKRAAGSPPPALPRRAPLHALWIGALGGLASGLLGLGGAVLMIPLLVWAVGLRQHEAQGTSLAVMLPPVGLPGVLVYARAQGGLPWLVIAVVATGFLLGGALGARVARRTGGARLVRGFAIFQLAVAAALAWRVFWGS
jgi:uncharacterized membrane protein YfcA